MIYIDDLIASLTSYFYSDAEFTCKDLTGAAELKTGTWLTLFPEFAVGTDGRPHIVPVKTYDTEEVPLPALGVAIASNPSGGQEWYGYRSYEYEGRLILLVNEKADYDDAIRYALQVENALRNHFEQDAHGTSCGRLIPWYRYRYDAVATRTLFGEFCIRDFRVQPLDDFRFQCSFTVEVIG